MDAFLDLNGKILEFSENGTGYDVTFDEFATYGNKEVYMMYDYEDDSRHLLVVTHDEITKFEPAQIIDLKNKAKNIEHLKNVLTNPATRKIKTEEQSINDELLIKNLGSSASENPKQAQETKEDAPNHVKRGMMKSGEVGFKKI